MDKEFERIKQSYEKAIDEFNQKREQLEAIRKEMLFILEDIKAMQAEMKSKLMGMNSGINQNNNFVE